VRVGQAPEDMHKKKLQIIIDIKYVKWY
jgi:hypothetical protein